MSERKKTRLNKDHPDFAEYKAKFDAIWNAYFAFEEETEKDYHPDWSGLNHPDTTVLRSFFLECNEDTKALQREYAYLFEEVPDDED